MNKQELIKSMAEKTSLNKTNSEKVLNAFIESVQEALANGEKVQLIGFGTFETKERAERVCLNPRTKEKIDIPAKKVPSFKAGKEFKEKINNALK
ncbi:MAG: DNA-binding protein HU [uncultured Clostridium sp.]